uniref:Trafficking protein particle complex subunit n=1 Tax=Amphimedon queenslandica TaxID=400682 RepID=A0A1X7UF16_AMPQE
MPSVGPCNEVCLLLPPSVSVSQNHSQLLGECAQTGLRVFRPIITHIVVSDIYETLAGTKFILNTDHKAGDLQETLQHIYTKIYVEYVIKNPHYKLGSTIDSQFALTDKNDS